MYFFVNTQTPVSGDRRDKYVIVDKCRRKSEITFLPAGGKCTAWMLPVEFGSEPMSQHCLPACDDQWLPDVKLCCRQVISGSEFSKLFCMLA